MSTETTKGIANPELQCLAAQINDEHAAAENALRAGLAHALRAGELLIAAKQLVPHGGWLPWLAANCKVSERTAQAYIRLAARRSELEAKSAARCAFEDLSFRQGLKLLAQSAATSSSPGASLSGEGRETKLKPNSRFIPSPDHYLYARNGLTELRVFQSDAYPGYYNIARIEHAGWAKTSSRAFESFRHPIPAEWIEEAFRVLEVSPDKFAWREMPHQPCLEFLFREKTDA